MLGRFKLTNFGKRVVVSFAIIAILLGGGIFALFQTVFKADVTGAFTISGNVFDQTTKKNLPDVNISLFSTNYDSTTGTTPDPITTKTNINGGYTLSVPDSSYSNITITKEGFWDLEGSLVNVNNLSTISASIGLKPGFGKEAVQLTTINKTASGSKTWFGLSLNPWDNVPTLPTFTKTSGYDLVTNEESDFDPNNFQLSPTGRLPEILTGSSAVYSPETDRYYIFGGRRPDGTLSDAVYEYDRNDPGEIFKVATLPYGNADGSAVYSPFQKQILYFAGKNPEGTQNDFYSFTPQTSYTITPTGKFNSCDKVKALALKESIFLFQESNNATTISSSMAENMGTGEQFKSGKQWSLTSTGLTPYYSIYRNTLYLLGGTFQVPGGPMRPTSPSVQDTIYQFNPGDINSTPLAMTEKLSFPITDAILHKAGNTVYLIGGQTTGFAANLNKMITIQDDPSQINLTGSSDALQLPDQFTSAFASAKDNSQRTIIFSSAATGPSSEIQMLAPIFTLKAGNSYALETSRPITIVSKGRAKTDAFTFTNKTINEANWQAEQPTKFSNPYAIDIAVGDIIVNYQNTDFTLAQASDPGKNIIAPQIWLSGYPTKVQLDLSNPDQAIKPGDFIAFFARKNGVKVRIDRTQDNSSTIPIDNATIDGQKITSSDIELFSQALPPEEMTAEQNARMDKINQTMSNFNHDHFADSSQDTVATSYNGKTIHPVNKKDFDEYMADLNSISDLPYIEPPTDLTDEDGNPELGDLGATQDLGRNNDSIVRSARATESFCDAAKNKPRLNKPYTYEFDSTWNNFGSNARNKKDVLNSYLPGILEKIKKVSMPCGGNFSFPNHGKTTLSIEENSGKSTYAAYFANTNHIIIASGTLSLDNETILAVITHELVHSFRDEFWVSDGLELGDSQYSKIIAAHPLFEESMTEAVTWLAAPSDIEKSCNTSKSTFCNKKEKERFTTAKQNYSTYEFYFDNNINVIGSYREQLNTDSTWYGVGAYLFMSRRINNPTYFNKYTKKYIDYIQKPGKDRPPLESSANIPHIIYYNLALMVEEDRGTIKDRYTYVQDFEDAYIANFVAQYNDIRFRDKTRHQQRYSDKYLIDKYSSIVNENTDILAKVYANIQYFKSDKFNTPLSEGATEMDRALYNKCKDVTPTVTAFSSLYTNYYGNEIAEGFIANKGTKLCYDPGYVTVDYMVKAYYRYSDKYDTTRKVAWFGDKNVSKEKIYGTVDSGNSGTVKIYNMKGELVSGPLPVVNARFADDPGGTDKTYQAGYYNLVYTNEKGKVVEKFVRKYMGPYFVVVTHDSLCPLHYSTVSMNKFIGGVLAADETLDEYEECPSYYKEDVISTVDPGDTYALFNVKVPTESSLEINYGLSADNLDKSYQLNDLNTDIDGLLDNLTLDTTYYYQITMTDLYGNEIALDPGSFTTHSIKNIVITSVNESSATISWETGTDSLGKIEYGTTTNYGYTSSESAKGKTHTVNLTGLFNNTTYHFRVKAYEEGKENNPYYSSDQTFYTQSFNIINLKVDKSSSDVPVPVKFTWETNAPATCSVSGSNAGISSIAHEHTMSVTPNVYTLFSITCTKTGTTETASVSGNFTVTLSIANQSSSPGSNGTTLSWTQSLKIPGKVKYNMWSQPSVYYYAEYPAVTNPSITLTDVKPGTVYDWVIVPDPNYIVVSYDFNGGNFTTNCPILNNFTFTPIPRPDTLVDFMMSWNANISTKGKVVFGGSGAAYFNENQTQMTVGNFTSGETYYYNIYTEPYTYIKPYSSPPYTVTGCQLSGILTVPNISSSASPTKIEAIQPTSTSLTPSISTSQPTSTTSTSSDTSILEKAINKIKALWEAITKIKIIDLFQRL